MTTLRETLVDRLRPLNISELNIEKGALSHGRSGTRISFVMDNPEGLDTGELDFEIFLANNMGITHDHMADLVYSYAINQSQALLMDKEIEV